MLSDDGLVVDAGDTHALALPTYPGLRLWPESVSALFQEPPPLAPVAHYSSKRRVVLSEKSASTPLPLAALYLLAAPPPSDEPDAISVSPLSSRDACIELIRHSFQLDVSNRQQAARLLAAASAVAERLPVFALTYPRDFACLPAVHAAIL